MIAIANPSTYPGPAARPSRSATMRKKRVSHARKHRNPSRPRRAKARRHARVHHNPAGFARKRSSRRGSSVGSKGLLKEFLSMDGAMLVGGGIAGATLPTWALNKFMPSLTGYSRIAAKAGLGLGIAWALSKFINKKLGLGFAVTAAASAVSEGINLVQLGAAIPAAPQVLQDHIAANPGMLSVPPSGFDYLPSPFPMGPVTLSGPYAPGLAGPYAPGLADGWC